ncbi:MAG: hypothetical protein AB4426_14490 [Xenococcaceae cyanobacterium]
MSEKKEFRRINQALGKQPKIGPFTAGQIIPLATILLLSWSVKEAMELTWLQASLFAAWLMGTSWILTGTRAWRFFSKFIATPYFTRAGVRYQSLLSKGRGEGDKTRQKAKGKRQK